MRRLIYTIISFLCATSFIQNSANACTIVKVTQGGTTFVGNNEDGTDPTTYLWFLPASKGKFGRIYFTLSDKWPQGGMNDQGLFYDGTAGPRKEILKSSDKPGYRGNLSEKILEECTTVEEAIALLNKYNLSYFRNGQMLLADKYGNSAIVEGDTIIYSKNSYQIATNYYNSNPALGGYPCYRHDIAETMIANIKILSMDAISTIMEAVHLDGYSVTQYTTVCDLENLKIRYFKKSDFTNYVEIDLKKELQKGERLFETKEFFKQNPAIQTAAHKIEFFQNFVKSNYENKAVKCTLEFSNDKLNGICKGYYMNGQIAWHAMFHNGRIAGKLDNWNENGNRVVGYEFLTNNQTNLFDYFPSGKLFLKIKLEKTYEGGIKPINIIVYNEDGEESYSGSFNDGILFINDNKPYSGSLSAYYEDGSLFTRTEYKNGLLDGTVKRFDKQGNIIKIEDYKSGNLIGVKRKM